MPSPKSLYHQLRSNEFLRNNLIFFIGSQCISFLNYVYYPVLGRLLPTTQFGELQVLVSFFTQIVIFITVLTLISTNIISNEKDDKIVNHTIGELEKITLYVGYTILALVCLLSPLLKSALKFESALPFIVIAVVLVVGIPYGFRTAYLRGKSDFLSTTIAGIITSFVKILASVILVLVGFKVSGAAGGILIAQLVGLLYAGYRAKRLGYRKNKASLIPDWQVLQPQAKYAGLVLFVSLITTLQYSTDVTIIKYLFSPEIAGQYAGIATISRIILFLTASFGVVLLSSVKLSKPPKINSNLLLHSLGMTLALGGPATLAFVIFPIQITHLLFGTKYDAFTHLLPLLSITMLLISLCNLVANYHIALRHYWVMLYVGIGAVATVILLISIHSSPDIVVRDLAIGSAVMLSGLLGWTGYRANFKL